MALPQNLSVQVGVASAVWLIAATVASHFWWAGVPWGVALLLAAMAELIVLTLLLLGSTLHDPVKRWELPPNPAMAQTGWRGQLARVQQLGSALGQAVLHKLRRRPAKV
ncbi:MAG: hypothetical protein RL559_994 [Pseudomonadota bacterium]